MYFMQKGFLSALICGNCPLFSKYNASFEPLYVRMRESYDNLCITRDANVYRLSYTKGMTNNKTSWAIKIRRNIVKG